MDYPDADYKSSYLSNSNMSVKSESVSMPMGSAGILGITQGESLSGIQIDPRTIVVGILIFVAAIKILSFVFR